MKLRGYGWRLEFHAETPEEAEMLKRAFSDAKTHIPANTASFGWGDAHLDGKEGGTFVMWAENRIPPNFQYRVTVWSRRLRNLLPRRKAQAPIEAPSASARRALQ